ncbi:hypothetical protein ON010_g7824 [Phytophthora cinnamomi]|nr:hypothetical protein ON010_g7824 [Phytophthora cinnamomi]
MATSAGAEEELELPLPAGQPEPARRALPAPTDPRHLDVRAGHAAVREPRGRPLGAAQVCGQAGGADLRALRREVRQHPGARVQDVSQGDHGPRVPVLDPIRRPPWYAVLGSAGDGELALPESGEVLPTTGTSCVIVEPESRRKARGAELPRYPCVDGPRCVAVPVAISSGRHCDSAVRCVW